MTAWGMGAYMRDKYLLIQIFKHRVPKKASTASQPAFVTIAIRPSSGETGESLKVICPTG